MTTKTALLLVGICCAAVSLSCRGAEKPAAARASAGWYHCPMHPDFVQERTGSCPICGMDLVLIPEAQRAAQGKAAGAGAAVERAATAYHCPMHPNVVQERPGECPICGMDLVVAPEAQRAAAAPPPRAIVVGADQQRILGVVVSPVEKAAGARTLRILGRVAPDETRLYTVNAGTEGSVRNVSPITTGSRVKKNQVLATYYAPDTLSVLNIYLSNIAGHERVRKLQEEGTVEGKDSAALASSNMKQRIMQLENYGVTEAQRDEIARTRVMPETIQVRAPGEGFILARNVSPGSKFDRGAELFRIADLSRVWVLADVFLHDAAYVRPGMRAQVTIPEQQTAFGATVSTTLPQFDPATRTMKVKLEVANPGYVLRPDMFVDVLLDVEQPPAVVVTADAVLDTGLAKTVFVETAPGHFEPRRVETGARYGERIEVVKGLSVGERVVTAGTFFLDSESRMRSSTSGAAAAEGAPVPTGHEHPDDGAGSHTGSTSPPDKEATHADAGSTR